MNAQATLASVLDADADDSVDSIAALWTGYKATGNRELRDRLVVHYSPLVKFAAGRVRGMLPPTIEYGDLLAYGIFGLMDAIERFEPERGLKFETYANARIRGSIVDELRSVDWIPRSIRTKAREIQQACSALEARLGRAGTEPELAAELGLTVPELQKNLSDIANMIVVPLDDLLHSADGGTTSLVDTLPDNRSELPGDRLEAEESRQLLARAISGLAERDKMVVTLYYYERLTLAEIGQVLGVTESRVCQIHTKAVLQLRSRLQHLA